MKAVRTLSGILAAILLFAFVSGCRKTGNASSVDSTGSSATANPIQVAALKGPTALGMLNLMNDNQETGNYAFTIKSKPDEVVALLTSKSVDIAAVPTNLAATLYNKNGSVKLLALNTLGVLYLLEKGDTVQSVKDLKGKTIYSTGQGAVPEYALNYVLEQNGLTVGKDVTVEYKTEHAELATLMAADKASVAVLPQPFATTVTSANADVRVALDLTKEWENINHTTLTMGCLVVRTEFLEKNPTAVAQFLAKYKESAEKAVANVDATAKLAEQFDIIKENVAKKAIPACNIVYIDGQDMKTKAIGFFNVLNQANPKSIGGKMPDENLYYINE